MAQSQVTAWTRTQDWAEVALGAVAALSPIWLTTSTAALWALVVLGVLIAADGLWSLAAPGAVAGEGVQVVLGALLFVSPWVLGYAGLTGAAWWSWVLGALTAVVAAVTVPVAGRAHTARLGAQH
jgi:hypothetical protein